jgi:hypothetical protein
MWAEVTHNSWEDVLKARANISGALSLRCPVEAWISEYPRWRETLGTAPPTCTKPRVWARKKLLLNQPICPENCLLLLFNFPSITVLTQWAIQSLDEFKAHNMTTGLLQRSRQIDWRTDWSVLRADCTGDNQPYPPSFIKDERGFIQMTEKQLGEEGAAGNVC